MPHETTSEGQAEQLPSNWGRWGADDDLGTLHHIDAAATARAAGCVRTGRHVSLARTTQPVSLTTGAGPLGAPAVMPAAVMQVVNFNGAVPLGMTDSLLVNTHNANLTHIDAVAHIPVGGQIYPGIPVAEAVTPVGAQRGSADRFIGGIVTRGVLLDLAPGGQSLGADIRVGAAELDAALERSGEDLLPGDALVLRGGWDLNQPAGVPVPGLTVDAVRWMDGRGVSVYVSDIQDPRPPILPMPMHQVALARLGMPLVDVARLEDLAAVCEELGRAAFMLVMAPPRISGTTGLPVNPIAIF